MKQQDEELTRHIKALFEDVDDGLSEHGWAELRKKYPEAPSRKLPIWWLSGIAASILVVAGLFLFTQKNNPKTTPTDSLASTPKTQKTDSKTDNAFTLNSPEKAENTTTRTSRNPVRQQHAVPHQDFAVNHQNVEGQQNIPVVLAKKDTVSKNITPSQQLIANQPNSNPVANQPVIAASTDQPAKPTKDYTPQKKTTEEFLREQSKILVASNTKTEEKQQELKNSFDVYTGTFVNYYANNAAKVNAGFGVNANIKVSSNISVSVGAGLSQNRLSYDNNNTIPRSLASDVSSQAVAYNVMSSESRISDIKVNAQLLSIDIPITVKFYPGKKKNFYLATGINSNSYLLQRYTYDYTVQNSAAFVKSVPIEKQTEESKFKGFDFANSAIIAVGLSQNLGRNTIIFEPYFKPTIGSMGEKNLKINTAGINLRFNFAGKKK